MTEFVTIGGQQRPFRWSFLSQNRFNELVHNAGKKGGFLSDADVIFIGLYYGELSETGKAPVWDIETVKTWLDQEPAALKQLNATFEKLLKKYGEAVGEQTKLINQVSQYETTGAPENSSPREGRKV